MCNQPVGIAFADVNGLKKINDNLGHEAGDELLAAIAKKIITIFQEAGCYRFGGDEFIILSFDKSETDFQNKLQKLSKLWTAECSASIGSVWLEHAKDRLSYLSPEGQLREKRKYAADLEEQLRNRMEHMIELRRHKLALLSERLEGVSPVKKLAQGYSYVTDENGHTLTDAEGVKAGDRVKIRLLKGALEAEVTEVLHER